MCKECGDFNYTKRTQRVDLEGRIALLTGSRVKIGYHTALKLLRDGALVLGTTRFPTNAAIRFSKERDFAQWKDRLRLYRLDLRRIRDVEHFTHHLLDTLPHLDIVVNNAAQTISRPPHFFAHLLESESLPTDDVPPEIQALFVPYQAYIQPLPSAQDTLLLSSDKNDGPLVSSSSVFDPVMQEYFPVEELDKDLQQTDLRPTNSWTMQLSDVPLLELLEVHFVNAIAPCLLISKLKSLMAGSPHSTRYIVNVSAMEGQYSKKRKGSYHPHTNMAKAALNMLTRTSAADYARDRIYMNSVDTGWVTDENPHPLAFARHSDSFMPPLDGVDGAARILDPIYHALRTQRHSHGKFFKDYKPTTW